MARITNAAHSFFAEIYTYAPYSVTSVDFSNDLLGSIIGYRWNEEVEAFETTYESLEECLDILNSYLDNSFYDEKCEVEVVRDFMERNGISTYIPDPVLFQVEGREIKQ